MAVYNFDTSDIDTSPRSPRVPRPGWFRFEIVKLEERTSKTGRPQLSVRLQCTGGPEQVDAETGEHWDPAACIEGDDGRLRGFTMFDNVPLPPFAPADEDPGPGENSAKSSYYFARFKEALGQKDNPMFDPSDFVGAELEVKVRNELYEGRTNPKVDAYNTDSTVQMVS